MINLDIFSIIENKLGEETKRILGDASAKKFNINRADTPRGNSATNVKTGSFDYKTDKRSVNISVLAGTIESQDTSASSFQMELDIYFSVVGIDDNSEAARRNQVYPVLCAILFHFSGLKIEVGEGQKIRLYPKGEFSQKYNQSPYLEYACCFSAKMTIEKSEEEIADFAGIVGQYFLQTDKMPYSPPEYEEVLYAAQ